MPNPFDTRNQQLLCAIQGTPGVMPSLGASNGKVRLLYGAVPEYQAPKETRNLARAAATQFGSLASTKAMSFALRAEVNTPDTITSVFEYDALLRACGHSCSQYRKIPIGAITSGPIARGATMTGGTSGATGRVEIPAVNGDGFIYYTLLTGTFQAEALTFTGGASATSSSVSSAHGQLVMPTKPVEVCALELQEDGYAWSARDAMGSLSMEFENSKAGSIAFNMMGVKNAMGKKTLTSGIAYDVQDPPIFQNAQVKIGSWSPVISKLSFEEGFKNVPRGNANAANNTGLEGFRLTGVRQAKFKVTLEHVDEDTFDFYSAHDNTAKYAFQFRVGTVQGKTFWGFADQGEIRFSGSPDADGIRQAELEIICTHTTDNKEYAFLSA